MAVRLFATLGLIVALSGCGGNPWIPDGGDTGGGTTTVKSVSELTGTTSPTAQGNIKRGEVKGKGPDGVAVTGNGFAQDYTYDPTADTFTVDNLAFDGGNVYKRDTAVPTLNGAKVYKASSTYADSQTGVQINQYSYRALYGTSTTGRSKFAIVRTGSYLPYGFGGFVFERNGGVVLPTTGQAAYSGKYVGMRDFDGSGGLQYVTGDMQMAIDFNDFNPEDSATGNGAAIRGNVSNRHVLDLNGTDITAAVIAQINDDKGLTTNPLTALPVLTFDVGPGVLDNQGEIEGGLASNFVNESGTVENLESGKYYGVISGDDADEVVGIIVVTSNVDSVTVRETGGFILYRP
jgi:hypothetical protein